MTDNLPDFEDLRHLGKTGRSYLISGDGRKHAIRPMFLTYLHQSAASQ